MQGNVEEGLAAMREGRGFAQQAGERSGAMHYGAVVIEALCSARQLDEAPFSNAQAAAINAGQIPPGPP